MPLPKGQCSSFPTRRKSVEAPIRTSEANPDGVPRTCKPVKTRWRVWSPAKTPVPFGLAGTPIVTFAPGWTTSAGGAAPFPLWEIVMSPRCVVLRAFMRVAKHPPANAPGFVSVPPGDTQPIEPELTVNGAPLLIPLAVWTTTLPVASDVGGPVTLSVTEIV